MATIFSVTDSKNKVYQVAYKRGNNEHVYNITDEQGRYCEIAFNEDWTIYSVTAVYSPDMDTRELGNLIMEYVQS
ncbi:hypothetical protein GCM10023149_33510 [Mucilaginibacter gynuensis]|uniref:DUF4367 domain-containing protein n=1 Tax=Mucilaginibacter gynuensis TaxID=1302236 RepID=A0ABP8GS06_9SPHI